MAVILAKAGHTITVCSSGGDALRMLGVRPGDDSIDLPDLVILDIMMPQVDGYAVATSIRNTPRTHNIPVLMVSALREMSQLFVARVRVDGFLTKPFAPEDLVGSVAKILQGHGAPRFLSP
ncbi:MAG: response regulator [Elusimicrobia bacterium]|nr:response regulator [Elusimicrobiota bacterium]